MAPLGPVFFMVGH